MRMAIRGVLVVAMATAVGLSIQGRTSGDDAELQFQLGSLLYDETRFDEAREAFRKASESDDPKLKLRARIGVVKTALLVGEFEEAQREAASLRSDDPRNPEAIAIHADSLWSAGLFDEAEREFRDALAIAPEMSRGRHGLAKALASRQTVAAKPATVRTAAVRTARLDVDDEDEPRSARPARQVMVPAIVRRPVTASGSGYVSAECQAWPRPCDFTSARSAGSASGSASNGSRRSGAGLSANNE